MNSWASCKDYWALKGKLLASYEDIWASLEDYIKRFGIEVTSTWLWEITILEAVAATNSQIISLLNYNWYLLYSFF